jgi:hypothetical protein
MPKVMLFLSHLINNELDVAMDEKAIVRVWPMVVEKYSDENHQDSVGRRRVGM